MGRIETVTDSDVTVAPSQIKCQLTALPRSLWIVGALACLVRLAAAVATGGLWDPQLNEYDAMAKSMLAGHGFAVVHLDIVYHSYAAPLYTWISAAAYWLTGSIVPVMLLQIVAGSALAVVAAAIACRLFGGWIAGAAAGVLVAFHPGLVVYSATKAHPLTFDALFFALTLLLVFRLAERSTVRRALELGVTVGVGALSRGTIVIFMPIAALWLLAVATRQSRAVVIRNLVVVALCSAAIIAPWTVRCSLLHHRFVFLLTTDSEDFWEGNNPYATGHGYVDAGHSILTTLSPEEQRDLARQPNEVAQADWFATQSRAFIRADPMAFLRLNLLKLFHFWWFAPQNGVLYPKAWLLLYMIYYVVALLLAALGVWRITQRGPPATQLGWLIGLFLLALSGLQSLYYVEGRHRWAVESLLLALSGGGIAVLVECRRHLLEARLSNKTRLTTPVASRRDDSQNTA
jgi:4-amino-4-deoxy-L-arabinose transferase-like glycosyltransferase